MSMLAEPRKRQRISINPDGVAWSSDSSKFGQRLMEKMGWQQGKGLGTSEDGAVSHVKVKMNMDNRGLGCSKKDADNWLAHQDDFNALLAQLSSSAGCADEGGECSAPSAAASTATAAGLVEKSKSSRKRVHYEKFTKGKDLSLYDQKHLAQIFGRRATAPAQSLPSNGALSALADASPLTGATLPTEPVKAGASNEPVKAGASNERSEPVVDNLVDSTLSVADYFARKMAAKRARQPGSGAGGGDKAPHVTVLPEVDGGAIDTSQADADAAARRRKRRKSDCLEPTAASATAVAAAAAAAWPPRPELPAAAENSAAQSIATEAGSDRDVRRRERKRKRSSAAQGDGPPPEASEVSSVSSAAVAHLVCRATVGGPALEQRASDGPPPANAIKRGRKAAQHSHQALPDAAAAAVAAAAGDSPVSPDAGSAGKPGLADATKAEPDASATHGSLSCRGSSGNECSDAGADPRDRGSCEPLSPPLASDASLTNKLRKLVERVKSRAAVAMSHFASSSSKPDRPRARQHPAPCSSAAAAAAAGKVRAGNPGAGPAAAAPGVGRRRPAAMQAVAPGASRTTVGSRERGNVANSNFFVGSNILSLRGYTGYPVSVALLANNQRQPVHGGIRP